MRWYFRAASITTRKRHVQAFSTNVRSASSASVDAIPGHELDLLTFRQRAFLPQKPLFIKEYIKASKSPFPAFETWFETSALEPDDPATDAIISFSPYMEQFQEWPFPYELVIPSGSDHVESVSRFRNWLLSQKDPKDQALAETLQPTLENSSREQHFFQLYAPLRLLMKTLRYNRSLSTSVSSPIQLYIAQSSMSSLPPVLQMDLPVPELVQKAGKGDVYDSSVWLGSEPTYTPLHRDPNPNLFYQLCGTKALRILPPADGDRVFAQVQAKLGRHGSSRIRTIDMMEGAEREMLHNIIWGNESRSEIYGVDIRPGDACFIPKGWWHSVKSAGSQGHLNSSVNWWFR